MATKVKVKFLYGNTETTNKSISSVDTNLRSCKASLALYMVMRDLGAAGITIIGVREGLLPPDPGWFEFATEGGILLLIALELLD